MTDVGDWRDKDDLELTAEDLGQMLDEGAPVQLVHPTTRSATWFVMVGPVATRSGPTVVRSFNASWSRQPSVTHSPAGA